METQSPAPKRGHSPLCPNFRPMFIVAKRTDGWIKMALGMEVSLSPGDFVLDSHGRWVLTCYILSDWLCADFWYKLVWSWSQLRFYVHVALPLIFFQFLLFSQANHTIDWKKTTVIDREQDRPSRWIMEAVHICKEGHRAVSQDEGSYQLSHAYDRFLDATVDRRIKTRKNWVPASSDEDLVMRLKCQNKV